jgi:hypothetical protein
MSEDEVRDWRPGDGITCRYAGKAPRLVPCGRPVKTRITMVRRVGRSDKYAVVSPVCAHHVSFDSWPSKVMAQATKVAREALIAAHYGEYQGLLEQAARELRTCQ